MTIALRPVIPSDQDFLFQVYASTRRDEMSAWGWDVAQQDAFLKMQFIAQQRSYETQDANRSHDIILLDDEPIGRLFVTRTSSEIHLVDIALLSARRGGGIGSELIRKLLDEGESKGLPVRLEVLNGNPAALLYERLGFVKTGERGSHVQMERLPSCQYREQ
jgi:ribosomal protein S18 acetylase RimI-like enzyme